MIVVGPVVSPVAMILKRLKVVKLALKVKVGGTTSITERSKEAVRVTAVVGKGDSVVKSTVSKKPLGMYLVGGTVRAE